MKKVYMILCMSISILLAGCYDNKSIVVMIYDCETGGGMLVQSKYYAGNGTNTNWNKRIIYHCLKSWYTQQEINKIIGIPNAESYYINAQLIKPK